MWQYGRNTKQAFKDYMEAKDKNNSSAWIELGRTDTANLQESMHALMYLIMSKRTIITNQNI
ncbi:hypothetical protein [Helicobacter suis]|uniref:hypothetical protein n=1 Tax=Helicobacter suis TaxID=104628 RepID=UPI00220322B6|nr:hypothetical protein [Helicobacter suis]BDR27984.1 hypothetical protein HSHS1_07450 [Helicobacter suis HS1]